MPFNWLNEGCRPCVEQVIISKRWTKFGVHAPSKDACAGKALSSRHAQRCIVQLRKVARASSVLPLSARQFRISGRILRGRCPAQRFCS
jgi:hypothetical protein